MVGPVARWSCFLALLNVTSKNGCEFLGKVLADMPFEVKVIQFDGGSEFKAEFEGECEARSIDFGILPPESPELNGCSFADPSRNLGSEDRKSRDTVRPPVLPGNDPNMPEGSDALRSVERTVFQLSSVFL